MVFNRAMKVESLKKRIPEFKVETGPEKGEVLILGWGSTYGSIKTATENLIKEGYNVAHAHLEYLNPFPNGVKEVVSNFDKV
ncbi:MAG: 2-oxoacid:acceptor oxidoreductase subunit alpha, partial [Flavobacteriales bacterium]